jgi:3-hydroxymyristoyl/3-hydroxydecanoyl-(acyl carrier protein) dehydratase
MVNILQQPPFRFVDEVLDYVGNTIRCYYTVRMDNPMLNDGLLSTEGMIECLAQTAAVKSVIDYPNVELSIGYLASIKSFNVYGEVKINDGIELVITFQQSVMQFSIYDGKILHNGKEIAGGELRIFDTRKE